MVAGAIMGATVQTHHCLPIVVVRIELRHKIGLGATADGKVQQLHHRPKRQRCSLDLWRSDVKH